MQNVGGLWWGNAAQDRDEKQWLIGKFMPKGCPLHDEKIEAKTAYHKAGEERPFENALPTAGKVISFLIHGQFRVCALVNGQKVEAMLSSLLDFVIWEEGTLHWWEAVEDSIVLTVVVK